MGEASTETLTQSMQLTLGLTCLTGFPLMPGGVDKWLDLGGH